MQDKHLLSICIMALILFINLTLFCSPGAAQDLWTALPPYNVLWPLWSPALSPPDALGVPTPLVTTLTRYTVLPVEPAIVWDPALPYFYLLYDAPWEPGIYYSSFGTGEFISWPPAYLTTTNPVTSVATPAPISLPLNYATLITFDPALWLNYWIPHVNTFYQSSWTAGINPNLLSAVDLLPSNYIFSATYVNLPPF